VLTRAIRVKMRIRVLHRPALAAVDGIDLTHFVPGRAYDVGTSLGALMLAEGWAAPIENDAPEAAPDGGDPFTSRVPDRTSPPNLIRETHPPTADEITLGARFERRKRPRPPFSRR
jgi:hypothetical protein